MDTSKKQSKSNGFDVAAKESSLGQQVNSSQSPPILHSTDSATKESISNLIEIEIIALRICQIIVPVALCLIYVSLLVRLADWNVLTGSNVLKKAMLHLGIPTSMDTTKLVINNLIVVSIFAGLILVVTLLVLGCFYIGWHSCLSYYFYMPSLIVMTIFTPAYLREIALGLNWFGLDLITVSLITWNFTLLGLVAIFSLYTSAPLCIQQFYLIHNSAILALLILNTLPSWTPWLLLGFLVIWDLFAVLAPFGPLNLIISLAEQDGIVDMPGIIYSTQPIMSQKLVAKDRKAEKSFKKSELRHKEILLDTIESDSNDPDEHIVSLNRQIDHGATKGIEKTHNLESSTSSDRDELKNIKEKGVNMGLGDFIFYGLLIGLTVRGRDELYTILATFLSILIGVILTLVILATVKKALPALPISLAIGLVVASISMSTVPKFADGLAASQIFV